MKENLFQRSILLLLVAIVLAAVQTRVQAVTEEQQAKLNQIDVYIDKMKTDAEYHYSVELACLQSGEEEDQRLLRVIDAGFLNVTTPEDFTDYIRAVLDLRGVNLGDDSAFSQALTDLRFRITNSGRGVISGDTLIGSGGGLSGGGVGLSVFPHDGDIETPVNIQRLRNIDPRHQARFKSTGMAGGGRANANQRGIQLVNGAFAPTFFKNFVFISEDNGNNFDNVLVAPESRSFGGLGTSAFYGAGSPGYWGSTSSYGCFDIDQINPAQKLLAAARTRYAEEENRTLRGFPVAQLQLQKKRDYFMNVYLPEFREQLRNNVLNPPQAPANGKVTGVVYSDDMASAVIGTRVIHQGEKIDDIKVVKINAEGVEFEKNGRSWKQKIGEAASSQWQ